MNMKVTMIDKPGSLMDFTNLLKTCDANIVQIDYDRNSVTLEFGEANVTVSLETKGVEHQKVIEDTLTKNGYKFNKI